MASQEGFVKLILSWCQEDKVTFTCACHKHPECRAHPQRPARQPLSHQVIIQSPTDRSKHKEHLRKKLPQGQCVVAFHCWGVIPGPQDSLHLAVPISNIKLKRWMWNIHSWKYCSHLRGCIWVPCSRNSIYTSFQPGWATTRWSSGWVWSRSCCFSKQHSKKAQTLSFLHLPNERDAKMGTGKMSSVEVFKGITLGQKYETKVFRLCQFS